MKYNEETNIRAKYRDGDNGQENQSSIAIATQQYSILIEVIGSDQGRRFENRLGGGRT